MLALLLMQVVDAPAPPLDWATLPALPYMNAPEVTPPLTSFVAGEITAGRCVVPKPQNSHYSVRVDVAALVGPNGTIRRIVPRAMGCATVEQYTAGLIGSFARDNLQAQAGAEQWYRATITYTWAG